MRDAYPSKSGAPGLHYLDVRIQGAGSSSPTTFKGAKGHISSVSRTAAGRYTIAFNEVFPQLEAVVASVQDTAWATTPTHKTARVIDYSATAKTLTVAVEEEGGYATDEWTNPLASAAAGLRAAFATTVAIQTWTASDLLTAGKDELAARPRNLTFTTAGATPSDAPASCVVTGTDIDGEVLTETFTLAQTATIAEGAKAFKTITSVVFAAGDGTGATIAMGYGNKFGLSKKAKVRTSIVNVLREISAGSFVTNGTFVVPAAGPPYGTYTPNTAPDGANDYAVTYEVDRPVDLASTQWLHLRLALRATSLGV